MMYFLSIAGDPAVRSSTVPVAVIMTVGLECCQPIWQRAAAKARIGPCTSLVKGGAMCFAAHQKPTNSCGLRTSFGIRSAGHLVVSHTSLAYLRMGAEMHLYKGCDDAETVRRHMCLGTPMGRLANVAAAAVVRAVTCLG